ncbi:hypothetical protein Dimus_014160 [Dionaea muscipula]
MDFNSIKAEKSKAMERFHRLRMITNLFRFVELCVLLGLLSWLSARLPFAVKISGEFCRWLASIIVSPLFVFAVGNAIIVSLMAKSGQFSRKETNASESEMMFQSLESEPPHKPVSDPVPEPEEIVYEDKEIICQTTNDSTTALASTAVTAFAPKQRDDEATVLIKDGKVDPDLKLLRCRSENLEKENEDMITPTEKMLRRSETDMVCRRKGNNGGEESEVEKVFPEDGLSSEEFRRIVEAFIAKQKKFRREESQAIVLLPGRA